jgi:hypothetical protein
VTINAAAYDMLNTFEQFSARQDYENLCDALRDVQQCQRIKEFQRCLLQTTPGGVTRPILAALAGANQREVFVATVAERGFRGKQRMVLLKDVHRFGLKFIFADHVWVHYDRLWERIEPFFQNLKVVVVGAVHEYNRQDGTTDYTLTMSKLCRLCSSSSCARRGKLPLGREALGRREGEHPAS